MLDVTYPSINRMGQYTKRSKYSSTFLILAQISAVAKGGTIRWHEQQAVSDVMISPCETFLRYHLDSTQSLLQLYSEVNTPCRLVSLSLYCVRTPPARSTFLSASPPQLMNTLLSRLTPPNDWVNLPPLTLQISLHQNFHPVEPHFHHLKTWWTARCENDHC